MADAEPSAANTGGPGACPSCGGPLPAGNALAGLCPACLLQRAAAPETGTRATGAGGPVLSVEAVSELFPQLQVIGVLGRGGMGAVYQVRQPALDRTAALKILPAPASAASTAFSARFEREARALARLSHPNIVTVYDVGQAGGYPYFLMEYVDGANLRQLQHHGRLSARQALEIVSQICDALQYAHDEGVVHRDIKPENILVDRKGRVKIADFGVAKLAGGDRVDPRLTAQGQLLGTPLYMAPEQIEHPLDVDHRADIYSLGVVFYELLTGELPLGRFPAPSHRVEIDVRLDEVVLRALEKEPALRYQQAGEVKTAVEQASGPGGGAAAPLTASAGTAEGDPRAAGGTGAAAVPVRGPVGREALCVALLGLPPALFLWFALGGYARFGIDLDAEYLPWVGFGGLPAAAGLGGLLAWAAQLAWPAAPGPRSGPPPRLCWRSLVAAILLVLSLPVAGLGLPVLPLIAQESHWHPAAGELAFVVCWTGASAVLVVGALALGHSARRRARRLPAPGWQQLCALAAAWLWPLLCLVTALLLALGSATADRARQARVEAEIATEAAERAARLAAMGVTPPIRQEARPRGDR